MSIQNINVDLIATIACTLVICVIGYLDYKYREVKKEWIYLLLILFGIFTDISWMEKIICGLFVPAVLLALAAVIGKKKGVAPTDVIGGADIKTIAGMGFAFGATVMAVATLLGVFYSFLFVKKPNKGLAEDASENAKQEESAAPDKRKMPFCTVLTLGLLTAYLLFFVAYAFKG